MVSGLCDPPLPLEVTGSCRSGWEAHSQPMVMSTSEEKEMAAGAKAIVSTCMSDVN